MVKKYKINENEDLLISIVTVVLNNVNTIEQTILSVISQSYNNVEYVIIDGGSTDGTLEIIDKYKDHIDLFICEPDKGLYDAMNKGISLTNGEIIGIINSDDWYESNAIKLIVDAYYNNPKKQIFHGDRYDIKDYNTKIIRKYNPSSFKFKYYGMTFNHPSMFVHKDVYEQRLYNYDLSVLADYEFVLTQFLVDKRLFCYISEAYVNYRLDGLSSRTSIKKSLLDGFISRKNAGMKLVPNIFSFVIRMTIFLTYKPFFTKND